LTAKLKKLEAALGRPVSESAVWEWEREKEAFEKKQKEDRTAERQKRAAAV
jgi:hypothetical protein